MNRKQIIAENEISEIREFNLGGVTQKVLIEGKDKKNPILLFLHGGPGTPLPFSEGCRGLFPDFTDKFIMVYWDQLGCGINNHIISDEYKIQDFVDMTVELIKKLKQCFPENELNLFGVSWGSILVARACSECSELVHRVLVYGQVLKKLTFNDEVHEALLSSNMSDKNKKELERIFHEKEKQVEDTSKVMRWVGKYTEGYQAKNGGKMALGKIIWGILTSPDYRFRDFKAMMMNGYRNNHSLIHEILTVDVSEELNHVKMPYRIMQGSTDIVTSTKMVQHFASTSDNPNLSFVLVENSGHMPSAKGMDIIFDNGLNFLLSK